MKDFIILIKTEEINMNKEKIQSEKRGTAKALIEKILYVESVYFIYSHAR